MADLERACRSSTNIIPPMIEAVTADATVGEIGDVFRAAFGDWTPPIQF
jgi:methylmalonyl-CoA mutase N-terminal domain/subunit